MAEDETISVEDAMKKIREFQRYATEREFGATTHRDGIDWYSAPVPRRLHRCSAQTTGYINYFTKIERCACGAIRRDGRGWRERNSSRKGR